MSGWRWARRATRRGAVAVVGGLLVAACASESDTPLELEGTWERTEVWERDTAFDYDRVATTNSPDAIAWLARADDAPDQLSYWEVRDGSDPAEIVLPTSGDALVIPVATASDSEGWAAVAVTRDDDRGENTGLVAWQGRTGRSTEPQPGQPLTPPTDLTGPPESVSVGRSTEAVAVAALYEGEPVLWSVASNEAEVDAWQSGAVGEELDLDDPADLVSLRVVGDGERLVLAGVDASGHATLWVSDDAVMWEAVATDDLPEEAGGIALLTAVKRGQVAVGWVDDEDDTQTPPWNATAVTVQLLEDDELTDAGSLAADPDDREKQIHLTSATLSPDGRLVVAGGVARPSGDRSPMVWAWDEEEWRASDVEALTGHLDHEFRAIVGTSDDRMVAVATALSHPDIETWQWRAED